MIVRIHMKPKDMTQVALMAALLCLAGPMTIAIGPIPLSLATFAVYLAGAILGSRRGALAVGLYLVIGIVGVPVFSGFSGGFQKLAGVTGGYLIGYLPCAFLTGLGMEKAAENRRLFLPLMMLTGTVTLYTIGTFWFMLQTGNSLLPALSLCVVPFLPGDAIKIAAATLLSVPVRRALSHARAL